MPGYSTVQAYSDKNNKVPALSYEAATGKSDEVVEADVKEGRDQKQGKFKFDKVLNVYGSSAGAGSGDFHAYRHSRDKEKRRIARNKAILKEKLETEAFNQAVKEAKEECDARTRRNRAKRRRKKERKARAKRMRKSASEFGAMEPSSKAAAASTTSTKSAANDSTTVKPASLVQKKSEGDGVAASASSGSEPATKK